MPVENLARRIRAWGKVFCEQREDTLWMIKPPSRFRRDVGWAQWAILELRNLGFSPLQYVCDYDQRLLVLIEDW